jgi:hypothetical protein
MSAGTPTVNQMRFFLPLIEEVSDAIWLSASMVMRLRISV